MPGFKDKSAKELNDQDGDISKDWIVHALLTISLDWERIKPPLLRALKYIRQQKIKEKIETTFISRINAFSEAITTVRSKMPPPEPCIFSPIIRFARSPPFVDLIKDIDLERMTLPFDDLKVKFLQTPVSVTPRGIPGIIASWKESADESLLALLAQRSISKSTRKGKERATNSRLELATSFFNCRWCREPISYPRILMHHCVRQRRLLDPEDGEDGLDIDIDIDIEVEDEFKKLVDIVWERTSY